MDVDAPFGLDDVLEAERRIMPYLRDTPLMSAWLSRDDGTPLRVNLKLDSLQVTGGSLVRGVLNAALQMPADRLCGGLVGFGTAQGSAIAYAAQVINVPATVYMARANTSPDVVRAMEQCGARVVIDDTTIADAYQTARDVANREGLVFIDPIAGDLSLIIGCATVAVEMLEWLPRLDVLVAFVGRGELIGGVALAAKQLKADLRVIGVDKAPSSTGSDFSHAPWPLQPSQHSARLTPGSRLQRTGTVNLQLANRYVDELALVTDVETQRAAHVLWSDLEVRTGYTGSGAVAAMLSGKITVARDKQVGIVISRAGGGGLF